MLMLRNSCLLCVENSVTLLKYAIYEHVVVIHYLVHLEFHTQMYITNYFMDDFCLQIR
jgi:hypothetical protein